jgi:hypothetical protein
MGHRHQGIGRDKTPSSLLPLILPGGASLASVALAAHSHLGLSPAEAVTDPAALCPRPPAHDICKPLSSSPSLAFFLSLSLKPHQTQTPSSSHGVSNSCPWSFARAISDGPILPLHSLFLANSPGTSSEAASSRKPFLSPG